MDYNNTKYVELLDHSEEDLENIDEEIEARIEKLYATHNVVKLLTPINIDLDVFSTVRLINKIMPDGIKSFESDMRKRLIDKYDGKTIWCADVNKLDPVSKVSYDRKAHDINNFHLTVKRLRHIMIWDTVSLEKYIKITSECIKDINNILNKEKENACSIEEAKTCDGDS